MPKEEAQQMSATDTSVQESHRIKITPEEIAVAVNAADPLETLELLAKIAGRKGALTDGLYVQFQAHKLYAALVETGDSGKIDSAFERGVKGPFRYLVIQSLVALRGGKRLSPTAGWPCMISCAKQMIADQRSDGEKHTAAGGR
jgi:hypothetical protein